MLMRLPGDIDADNARELVVAIMARALKDSRSRAVSSTKRIEAAAAREFLSSTRAAELTALALPDVADGLPPDEICRRLLTTDIDD